MLRTSLISALFLFLITPLALNAQSTASTVDLIIETDTYIPPFYKGRSLPIDNSDVRVIAMPDLNTTQYSPNELIYEWSYDGRRLNSISGVGQQVYEVPSGIVLREPTIKVTVSSPDGAIDVSESIEITTHDPEVLLYYESPLYGIEYGNALMNTVKLVGRREAVLTAVPYYYNISSPAQLSYEWLLNGSRATNGVDHNTFRVRAPEDESGRSTVSVTTQSQNVTQPASREVLLTF